jgi:hypothetical protein
MAKEHIKMLREIFLKEGIRTPEICEKLSKKTNVVHCLGSLLIARKFVRKTKFYDKGPKVLWTINPQGRERALRFLREAYPDEFPS